MSHPKKKEHHARSTKHRPGGVLVVEELGDQLENETLACPFVGRGTGGLRDPAVT